MANTEALANIVLFLALSILAGTTLLIVIHYHCGCNRSKKVEE